MKFRPEACLATALAVGVVALAGSAHGAPYTFIQPGYTAQVVALNPGFLGGWPSLGTGHSFEQLFLRR